MMPVKPTEVRVLVTAAQAGFVIPAAASADCPELERLQSAYFEASQHHIDGVPNTRTTALP